VLARDASMWPESETGESASDTGCGLYQRGVRAESTTAATTLRRPPHGHDSTSVANTRRNSSVHGTRLARIEPLGDAAAGGARTPDVCHRRAGCSDCWFLWRHHIQHVEPNTTAATGSFGGEWAVQEAPRRYPM